jgi:hypothetical protein
MKEESVDLFKLSSNQLAGFTMLVEVYDFFEERFFNIAVKQINHLF